MGRTRKWLIVLGTTALLSGCGNGSGQVFHVPSSPSMAPTLPVGATVQSQRQSPKLGSVVVFHPPSTADAADPVCGNPGQGAGHPWVCAVPATGVSRELMVKRVVGLPGDRISIVNGIVQRNGAPLREPYVAACDGAPNCDFPKPVTIPGGEYFVLGDNRGESDDSRYWGPVRSRDIVGVVVRCEPSRPYCTHG